MEWLQTVGDVIILVGAILVAIKTICEWFGKPISFFKKKTDVAFDEKVVSIIKRVMPDLFLEHDLQIRDKYRSDREAYLKDIKSEVLQSIQTELVQVKDLAEEVSVLTEQYVALVVSAKDVLREKIMVIYYKNKKDKTLTFHEKEALDQYILDYKAMKGNSYIDKYYKRMLTWQIIDDDYQDE